MNNTQLRLMSLQRRQFINETSDDYPETQVSVSAAVKSYYRCKNWDGLLKYLESLQTHHMLVNAWKWQIGQMYTYMGAPQKALNCLFPLHCRRPEQQDIQLAISEALLCMGQKNDQFHWIQPPHALKVDEEHLLHCLEWVNAARKPIPLYFLHNCITTDTAKPVYNKFDLAMTLKHDPRFNIINSTPFYRYSFVEKKEYRGAALIAAPLY